jgi:hypothetical protein
MYVSIPKIEVSFPIEPDSLTETIKPLKLRNFWRERMFLPSSFNCRFCGKWIEPEPIVEPVPEDVEGAVLPTGTVTTLAKPFIHGGGSVSSLQYLTGSLTIDGDQALRGAGRRDKRERERMTL